jgi:hypothetical protein
LPEATAEIDIKLACVAAGFCHDAVSYRYTVHTGMQYDEGDEKVVDLNFSSTSVLSPRTKYLINTLFCFRVPLLESIVERGWCKLVPQLLNIPEHDSREKVLNLMWTVNVPCHMEFSNYVRTLESLKLEYSDLAKQEVQDVSGDVDVSYFAELLQKVDRMIETFPTAVKDEL